MATVVDHLSVDELEAVYRASVDLTQARHFQAIWLLAKGHTAREVSEATSFGERWTDPSLARVGERAWSLTKAVRETIIAPTLFR
ncbi:MAG TPA: hypothetical protein VN715_19145 [Roseiarcus sp.]|nr:hypothetical protein [Roseiarcus sp.]